VVFLDSRERRGGGLKALREAEPVGSYLTTSGPEGRVSREALFRQHHKKVVTWCLRFTGDKEEANDLAQAIFLKAFRQLGSFRGESKISTWLYSITRSECMNYLKARSARPSPVEEEFLGSVPDAAALSPLQMLERARSGPLVQSLLDRALDETEKRVFTLHYGDEMPLDVITRLLGLTNRSGAKAFIVSARRKISRLMQQWNARELRLFTEGGAR
jgi:RNA polymerase sigma factor (sigma-70 family)